MLPCVIIRAMKQEQKKKSRHEKYKVGTCKITVTVENEDKVRVARRATNMGYKDSSAYLREIIHEAVWDVVLTDDDYETLKKMRAEQEAK